MNYRDGPKKEAYYGNNYGVNKFRESLKLGIIVRGKRNCLMCDKDFFSYNLKANKLCDLCSKRAGKELND